MNEEVSDDITSICSINNKTISNPHSLSVSTPVPVHSLSDTIRPNITQMICPFQSSNSGALIMKVTSPENVTNRKAIHNQSEKMRIQKINEKIKELQDVLERHGKLKKRDKNSIVNDIVNLLTALLELQQNLEKELQNAANSIIFPQNSHICDFSSVFKKNAVAMVILNQYNAVIESNDRFKELSGYKDSMRFVFKKFIKDPIERYEFISCLTEVFNQSNITSSFTATCNFPNNSVCNCYLTLSSFQHFSKNRYISLCLLPLL